MSNSSEDSSGEEKVRVSLIKEAEEEDVLCDEIRPVDQDDDAPRRRRLENVIRRMSSTQQNNGAYQQSHPVRRGRRRAVTTSDHKSCALVQTRLKLGDIM